MGAAFRIPVAVDNWDSLQKEARRIHNSLEKFLQERPSISQREFKEKTQRFLILKGQWYRIHTLLHKLSKHNSASEDEYVSLTSDVQYQWLEMMNRTMEHLLQQADPLPISVRLKTIAEGHE
jgi:Ser-tRNA(Ala) deacylase AlaX